MKIGILTIHDLTFHPNARLHQAARHRNHRLILINPYQIVCVLENQVSGIDVCHDAVSGGLPDVVLPRQGSPMGEYGFVLLRQFQAMGIRLINGLKGVTIARHQYITLQTLAAAGIPVPDTCFVTRPATFFHAVDRLGGYPVVVKQPSGMGGDGVFKIDDADQARSCMDARLDPVKGLLVQRFIPISGRVDARILVIGDRVAGAMTLVPALNDFRTNIHRHGQATAFDPPASWKRMAVAAAKACCLDIAGIDMMGTNKDLPCVIEVNYAPGFRGLEAATGIDIAMEIIDFTAGTGSRVSVSAEGKQTAGHP
ncbi:MAG: RimK family alpha-L-glutamate ligase [Desulfotignum sp.]